ncbi:MAG: hypothetical protein M3237_15460 [Actinomycetota bacterium]|nr:hypothetical protein [Actinomycetota bacterium]
MTAGHVVEPDPLTAEWLTAALGRTMLGVHAEPVGTGHIGAASGYISTATT